MPTPGPDLLEQGGISLFELSKFASHAIKTEEQRWLKFFKDGERLDADHLPDWMQTTEMRQAMSTVKQFSEKERAYDAYQARTPPWPRSPVSRPCCGSRARKEMTEPYPAPESKQAGAY